MTVDFTPHATTAAGTIGRESCRVLAQIVLSELLHVGQLIDKAVERCAEGVK